jgi:transposase InsO family protein
MNGKTKAERHQEHKAQKRKAAKRKAKTTRFQTEARRRQADLKRRKRQQRPRKVRPLKVTKDRRRAVRRYRHLKEVLPTEQESAEQAARQYKTSPSTLRRWDKLHRQGGLKALQPQSKRPQTIHYHIPLWVKGLVVRLRLEHGWGQHRISAELKRRQVYSLSHRSVRKILDAQPGVSIRTYHPRGKSNGIAYRRWGRACPNDLWHIDFKGPIRLEDGTEAEFVVLLDARSRYCVGCEAQIGAFNTEQTQQACLQAFAQFGLPRAMLSDNGSVFSSRYEGGTTRFSDWLEDQQDINHLQIQPYYPECNGKAEAFIKTLKRELLSRRSFANLADLQAALNRFVYYYNHYRGHSRFGWQAPVLRYVGQAPDVVGVADIPGLEEIVIPGLETATVQPPPEVNPQRVAAMRALVPIST